MNILSAEAQLQQLILWVSKNIPFLYTRYNDGEFNGMFNLVPATATTSGEHHHFRDLGAALLNTFKDLAQSYTSGTTKNLLIGSYWHTHPNDPGSVEFIKILAPNHWDTTLVWSNSDLWYNTKLEEQHQTLGTELIRLVDTIRSNSNPVVLVGNYLIAPASKALGATFLEIPRVDAWLQSTTILKRCKEFAQQGATFVWCSGLPGKVWMWKLYKKYPSTKHIDAGHSFDNAYGNRSRAWHRREDGAHYKFVQETLKPYLNQF